MKQFLVAFYDKGNCDLYATSVFEWTMEGALEVGYDSMRYRRPELLAEVAKVVIEELQP